jgi:NAD(P)H-nitrite reductase large subunit
VSGLDRLDHPEDRLDHREDRLDHPEDRLDHRERIVVVGQGMAATRLVEELVARDTDASITVIGDEPTGSYNRILLSAVLEGSHVRDALTLRSESWYDDHGVAVMTGTRVAEIDRVTGEVVLEGGTRVGYDRLVLATGSVPTLPPIRGLVSADGRLHPKVHAFRSVADLDRLEAALPDARRAVVVGGGLLGLQVARALSIRGVETEMVEGGTHLLRSQVGARAGGVLARSLSVLGTAVYTEARAVRLTDDGLRLDNGYVLETDLVVLTAGARPATSLARRAGLFVRRGVVVDATLTSVTDERISALGDCAEHRGRTTGFVAPAWEQAEVLADALTGGASTYTGDRSVARLRATGLDVAVLGDPENAVGEVVERANPLAGTYRKAVVRDGVLEAAVLVGDLSSVGLLTQLYDRRTVLGRDEPGWLLTPPSGAVAEPPVLADDVEVCACAGVTAGRIRACASVEEAAASTRATTGCGGCSLVVRDLVGTRAVV